MPWLEDGAFNEMATMVTDLVRGMKVEREKAVTTEWEDRPYYFCSRSCCNEFLEKPQQFLNAGPQYEERIHAEMPGQ